MTLAELLELTIQAVNSAQNVGIGIEEMTVLELNLKNNPPTLMLESTETALMPKVRFISIL